MVNSGFCFVSRLFQECFIGKTKGLVSIEKMDVFASLYTHSNSDRYWQGRRHRKKRAKSQQIKDIRQ